MIGDPEFEHRIGAIIAINTSALSGLAPIFDTTS